MAYMNQSRLAFTSALEIPSSMCFLNTEKNTTNFVSATTSTRMTLTSSTRMTTTTIQTTTTRPTTSSSTTKRLTTTTTKTTTTRPTTSSTTTQFSSTTTSTNNNGPEMNLKSIGIISENMTSLWILICILILV